MCVCVRKTERKSTTVLKFKNFFKATFTTLKILIVINFFILLSLPRESYSTFFKIYVQYVAFKLIFNLPVKMNYKNSLD